MPGYPSNPSGLNQAMSHDASVINAAKAGNPKGSSGTYSDVGNEADPSEGTIARNEINKPAEPKPAGSTSDTGRIKP
jgi:hypothetical protein